MTTEKLPTSTSTSKYRAEEFTDVNGVKRVRIVADRVKFGMDEKLKFLAAYADHGMVGKAANAAGVSAKTVRGHAAKDPEFGAMLVECEDDYHDRLVEHHQNLLFDGQVKEVYDRNGAIVSKETTYPIRLIEMELKKHDEGYRDKRELKVAVSGGVLIAPAEMKTIDDWEQKFSGEVIEGEVLTD